jgi:dolichol-phosphate mannosyltransferase
VKIVVGVESAEQEEWLDAIDLASAGIDVVPFVLSAEMTPPPGARVIEHARPGSLAAGLPSFAHVVEGLEAERADACFVLSDGTAARLLTVAADMTSCPVFQLVSTAEHLRNLPDRPKAQPDLFFLADQELFPQALLDRRYGSTLLPSGHPARQSRASSVAGAGGPSSTRWGDGRAGERIVSAIAAWREGRLGSPSPELSVIVPSFREAPNLPLVCGRLLSALEGRVPSYEILLVDDASPDDTYQVALAEMWRSPHIRALTKSPPRGMGNAIRSGLDRARAQIVAITMGDGSDEVERIPEMFARVKDDGFALAIGSRYRHRINYQSVPRLYRFWSACFRWCTRLAIGLRLSDYTNAFRVFHRRIFVRYAAESGGFEISPETTFKAWFATRRVTEVDVRHLKRAAGQSSFSFLRAGPGYGRVLTKAFLNRLTGRWFTVFW